MKIVIPKKITESSSISIYFSTKGSIIVFAAMVGIETVHFHLRSILAPTAPISVAREPKTISTRLPVVIRFAIMQPTVTPGIAAAEKKGSTHKASEILICIGFDASPRAAEIIVNTTYIAAIIAAWHRKSTFAWFLLFFIFIFSLVLFCVRMVTNSQSRTTGDIISHVK